MKRLAALFCLGSCLFSLTAAAKQPNILFIIADDQSPYDFKFYDPNSPLDSPVLSKLAAEGMGILSPSRLRERRTNGNAFTVRCRSWCRIRRS